jgi:hypothetical protein
MAAVVMTAASCGAATSSTSTTPSPGPVVTTPASTPSAAALVFKLNGVGTVKATGTMTVTTQPGSLTVELKITGLQAASIHVSHIHIGSCAARGNIKFALNPVVADGQGEADVRSTVKADYPPKSGSWYVVVHAGPDMSTSTSAKYLLCGNLFK